MQPQGHGRNRRLVLASDYVFEPLGVEGVDVPVCISRIQWTVYACTQHTKSAVDAMEAKQKKQEICFSQCGLSSLHVLVVQHERPHRDTLPTIENCNYQFAMTL